MQQDLAMLVRKQDPKEPRWAEGQKEAFGERASRKGEKDTHGRCWFGETREEESKLRLVEQPWPATPFDVRNGTSMYV
jgi:hypothetical protein